MAELETLRGQLPTDPDAQATVTDFLDYTEYLPSDLVRSLRLIGNLDDAYLSSAETVHKRSKVYGSLPGLSPDKRPSSQYLRQEISHNLDHAINARESAYAEASRLYDKVDRHYSRIGSIISKLQALPKPPSRDPTPIPRVRSPQISRAKTRGDGTPPPRITLRLDGPRNGASAGRIRGASVQKSRYRSQKVTVPGEVLPPPNPDSPPPITDSEWEIGPISPIPVATSRVGVSSRSRPIKPSRIRVQKSPNTPKLQKLVRPPRIPGAMGTNVHSAVAGISTSNALSLLDPPPPNAKPGTVHAPWMRLTEWEMAKLRKRMKKNAIWSPSETMIRRELSDAGRGPENYRATKARCDEAEEEFLDEDNIATSAPGKPLAPGEISSDALSLGYSQLSNRGMKLNEAKKAKKETVAREQAALAAAEAELAAKRLADVGSSMKSLFNKPIDGALLSPLSPITSASQPNGKSTAKEKAKVREKEREREKAKEIEKQRRKDAEIEEKRQQEREEAEKRKEREVEEEARRKEEERQQEIEAEVAREQEKERERERERQREQEIEQEKQRVLEEEERQKELARLEEIEKEKQRQKEVEMSIKAPARKRKRDVSPQHESPDSQVRDTASRISSKRSKVETTSVSPKLTTKTVTTIVPLAAPAPPATPTATATSARTRRQSLTLKGPAPPPPPISTEAVRSSSRASSRRGSTGPPSARPTRDRHPRTSTTPAATPTSVPPTPVMTAASRRSKRPAPGPVTSVEEGAPAVSIGKRKNAPRKRGTAAAASAAKKAVDGGARAKEQETRMEEDAAGEDIDPDEPRYCICGDVSWGDMICCENNEVSSPGIVYQPIPTKIHD